MATKNDVTGDLLVTKGSTDAYRSGWDRIFGNKKTEQNAVKITEKVITVPHQERDDIMAIRDQLVREWHEHCAKNAPKDTPLPTFREWVIAMHPEKTDQVFDDRLRQEKKHV